MMFFCLTFSEILLHEVKNLTWVSLMILKIQLYLYLLFENRHDNYPILCLNHVFIVIRMMFKMKTCLPPTKQQILSIISLKSYLCLSLLNCSYLILILKWFLNKSFKCRYLIQVHLLNLNRFSNFLVKHFWDGCLV